MKNAEYVLVSKPPQAVEDVQLKVYFERWVVLAVFFLFCLVNSIHWVQYTIVADLVARYYDIPVSHVDWTAFVFMATIVFLVLPACFMIDRMGMRSSMLFAGGLMMTGAWLKVVGGSPGRFSVVLLGQTMAGIAQLYMVGTPSKVASIWFGAEELSTACSIGVFGNQLGMGIGLILPPTIVRPHEDVQDVGRDISLLSYIVAGMSTVIMALVVFLFKARPLLPPSRAQALERASPTTVTARSFMQSLGRLLHNRNYLLLMLSNSIANGMLNMFVAALNMIILRHFPNGQQFAGRVGLVIILSGLLGCVIYGYLLDKTHKYKEIALTVYVLMIVSSALFGYVVTSGDPVRVYIGAGMLGIFVMGYAPIALEVGAELTYPESESSMGSMLLVPGNILGILLTMAFSELQQRWGDLCAYSFVCSWLVLGLVLAACIRRDYRRFAANSGTLDDSKVQMM